MWFGRDTTSAAAPQDTALVLHFHPNRLAWKAMERTLGRMTLVSNRPLTVANIQSFANGEFSVFVGNDGTRSVAVRSSKNRLPTAMLDSLGILSEETSRGVYLLSDRPVARMNWKPRRVWFGFIHWPGPWRIGNAYMVEDQRVRGPIYVSGTKTVIRLPRQDISTIPWKRLPADTILALAMPALPNTTIEGVTSSIDTVLSSYSAPSAALLVGHLISSSGSIVLTSNEKHTGFLMVSDAEDFAKDLQQKAIQMASALQSPRFRPLSLPDGSIAKEMIVDPGLITVEETTIAGTLVSRVASAKDEYLFAAQTDESFLLTNDQDLLEFRLNGAGEGIAPACMGNALYLRLDGLLDASSAGLTARTASQLSMLGDEYSTLSVDRGWAFTRIRLCR